MWEVELEQAPKLGVPVSTEHSMLAPDSALKSKVGVESLVGPFGPEVTEAVI